MPDINNKYIRSFTESDRKLFKKIGFEPTTTGLPFSESDSEKFNELSRKSYRRRHTDTADRHRNSEQTNHTNSENDISAGNLKELINEIKKDNSIAHAQKHYSSDLNLDAYYKFFTERGEKISKLSIGFTDPNKIKEVFDSKYREITLNIAGKIKRYQDEINNKQKKHTPETKENLKEKLIAEVKSTFITKFIPAFKNAEVEAEKILSEAENALYPTLQPTAGDIEDPSRASIPGMQKSIREFMREVRQITSDDERNIRIQRLNDFTAVLMDQKWSSNAKNQAWDSIEHEKEEMLKFRVEEEKEQKFLEYRDSFIEEAEKQIPQNAGITTARKIRSIYEQHCKEMVDDPNFYKNIPNSSIENALNKAKFEAIIELHPMPESHKQDVRNNLSHLQNMPEILNSYKGVLREVMQMQPPSEIIMEQVNRAVATATNSPNHKKQWIDWLDQSKNNLLAYRLPLENKQKLQEHQTICGDKIKEITPQAASEETKQEIARIINDSYEKIESECSVLKLNELNEYDYSKFQKSLDFAIKDVNDLIQKEIDKHPIPEDMQNMQEADKQLVRTSLWLLQKTSPATQNIYEEAIREIMQIPNHERDVRMQDVNSFVKMAVDPALKPNERMQAEYSIELAKNEMLEERKQEEREQKFREYRDSFKEEAEKQIPQNAGEVTKLKIREIYDQHCRKMVDDPHFDKSIPNSSIENALNKAKFEAIIDPHPIPKDMQEIMKAMPEPHKQLVQTSLWHLRDMPKEILDSFKGAIREVVQMRAGKEMLMQQVNDAVEAMASADHPDNREKLGQWLDAATKTMFAYRLPLENKQKLQEHQTICGDKIKEITPQAASEETKQEIAKIINDSYEKIESECSVLKLNELNEYDYSKFQKSLDFAIKDVNDLIQKEIDKHPIPEDMQNMQEADKQLVQTSLWLLQKTSPATQNIYEEAIREIMQIPNHERDARMQDVNSFARMAVDPTLQPHERKQAEYSIDEQKNQMLKERVQRERNHTYEKYEAIFNAAAKDHTPDNADESTKKEIKNIFNFYLEEPERLYQSLQPKELSEGNYSEYLENLSKAKEIAKDAIQFEINRNVKKALENFGSCTPLKNAIINNFSAAAQERVLKERAFEKGGLIENAVQRREKISEIADHFDITSKEEIKKLSEIIDAHGSPLQKLSNAAQKLSNGGQKLMNSVQKTVSKGRR